MFETLTYLSLEGEHQALDLLARTKGLQQAVVEIIIAIQACNEKSHKDQ